MAQSEPDTYYVGIQPTVLDFEGSQVCIGPNTVVHRDSEIRAAYPSLFTPLTVDFGAPVVVLEVAKPEKAEKHTEKRTVTR